MKRPRSELFEPVSSSFEANIPDVKTAASFNVCFLDEIVFVDVISQRPDDSRSGSCGSRFGSELDLPLMASIVFDIDFLGSARFYAFYESKLRLRIGCSFRASGSIKQVATFQIARLSPQDCMRLGRASLYSVLLLFLFLFFVFLL